MSRNNNANDLQGKRSSSLDLIKIIATMFILFHHYQQHTGIHFKYLDFFNGRVYFGHLVELFFMISGYVMVPYIYKILNGKISPGSFFLKRYIRLIPAVAVSTAACSVASFFMSGARTDPAEVLSVSLGVHSFYSTDITVNNPMWYISSLLFCYLVFYVVCFVISRLMSRSGTKSLVLTSVLVIITGYLIITSDIGVLFLNEYNARGLMAFFSGLLLGMIPERIRSRNILLAITIPLFIISLICSFNMLEMTYSRAFIPVCILLCFVPLIIAFQSRFFTGLIRSGFITLLAGVSFHAYCWHCFILAFDITLSSDGFINMISLPRLHIWQQRYHTF